ncbi:MAG: hypothetical protein IJY89_03915, partial [Clostridia bacterium]|nr:hypothetical protein [Clostridia bacterium]
MQKGISYYLGIDGGGTKTAFVLANGRGRVLERLTLGACNPNDVGFEETFAVLKRGILTVCSGYPMEEISVFAGLAGCSSAENMPRITAFLSTFGFGRYKNHNDAVSAVSAALQGADGIAVTMGTGSIAYAKRGEELFRIGGYGYLFGDEGSGFALGRDAILAALQYEDGSGEKTLLYDLVRAQCGGQTVLSRIDHFYAEGKREIARYAPLVFKGVKEEDAVSKKILQKNLSAIAAMIRGGAARLSTEEIPVVLCGGLTAQGQILLPMLG